MCDLQWILGCCGVVDVIDRTIAVHRDVVDPRLVGLVRLALVARDCVEHVHVAPVRPQHQELPGHRQARRRPVLQDLCHARPEAL